MNSKTSWLRSSRKNSVIASAESPTRKRAPGGSFIWPKTIPTFDFDKSFWSITPASLICLQRLLPSRAPSLEVHDLYRETIEAGVIDQKDLTKSKVGQGLGQMNGPAGGRLGVGVSARGM